MNKNKTHATLDYDFDLMDTNIYCAVRDYYLYGLYPGSYLEQMIRGNPAAVAWAHPSIKNPEMQNFIKEFVKLLPESARGDNFDFWEGVPEEDAVFMKMSSSEISLLHKWISMPNYAPCWG